MSFKEFLTQEIKNKKRINIELKIVLFIVRLHLIFWFVRSFGIMFYSVKGRGEKMEINLETVVSESYKREKKKHYTKRHIDLLYVKIIN